MGKPRKQLHKLRPVPRNCTFCHSDTNPTYNDPQTLGKYVTERGKILGQARTGICSRHQRMVTTEIKRARHVAFLPFVVRA